MSYIIVFSHKYGKSYFGFTKEKAVIVSLYFAHKFGTRESAEDHLLNFALDLARPPKMSMYSGRIIYDDPEIEEC